MTCRWSIGSRWHSGHTVARRVATRQAYKIRQPRDTRRPGVEGGLPCRMGRCGKQHDEMKKQD